MSAREGGEGASSRRVGVPFDSRYFEKRVSDGAISSAEAVFRDIYRRNHWAGTASPSGAGASPDQTAHLRRTLPEVLRHLAVGRLLDLPCGDYSWMRLVDLPVASYIGGDLLPELVRPLQSAHGNSQRRFVVLDLLADELPGADLLLCRDCLVHLSFGDIRRAMANVLRADIRYLLTTTFPTTERNEDIVTGDWRPLNLERAPFEFPTPAAVLNEHCTEGGGAFADKSLGRWRADELRDLPFLTR